MIAVVILYTDQQAHLLYMQYVLYTRLGENNCKFKFKLTTSGVYGCTDIEVWCVVYRNWFLMYTRTFVFLYINNIHMRKSLFLSFCIRWYVRWNIRSSTLKCILLTIATLLEQPTNRLTDEFKRMNVHTHTHTYLAAVHTNNCIMHYSTFHISNITIPHPFHTFRCIVVLSFCRFVCVMLNRRLSIIRVKSNIYAQIPE